MTVLNLQVGASTDDVSVIDTSPPDATYDSIDMTTTFPLAGRLGGGDAYGDGTRFTSVAIGQADAIDAASLVWTPRNTQSGTAVNSNIDGEDADNAVTFSTIGNYTGRARTTALVVYDNIGTWTNDVPVTSPELKTVIQEIVDRGSWASGNDLVTFWENDGSDLNALRGPHSYDADTAKATKLDITYTAGGAQTITGAGIASAEAFGSATVALAVQTITGSSIASAEAFGGATVSTTVTVTAGAIGSLEAFGAATITTTVTITGSGIASAEAFGSASVAAVITGAGIASAEAFGGATITTTLTFTADGIASLEAFGAASVAGSDLAITGSGIASLEAFGAATVTIVVMFDFGKWRKQINPGDYPTGAEFFFEAVIATSDAGFTAYA
ncbi:hypothetical protein LCGC14_2338010, partial [marine sediment metagenome]